MLSNPITVPDRKHQADTVDTKVKCWRQLDGKSLQADGGGNRGNGQCMVMTRNRNE